jgi:hypothetical protein
MCDANGDALDALLAELTVMRDGLAPMLFT